MYASIIFSKSILFYRFILMYYKGYIMYDLNVVQKFYHVCLQGKLKTYKYVLLSYSFFIGLEGCSKNMNQVTCKEVLHKSNNGY
jgi:hypothetical protein